MPTNADYATLAISIFIYNVMVCLFAVRVVRCVTAPAAPGRGMLDWPMWISGAVLVLIPLLTWVSGLVSKFVQYGVPVTVLSVGAVLAAFAWCLWGRR